MPCYTAPVLGCHRASLSSLTACPPHRSARGSASHFHCGVPTRESSNCSSTVTSGLPYPSSPPRVAGCESLPRLLFSAAVQIADKLGRIADKWGAAALASNTAGRLYSTRSRLLLTPGAFMLHQCMRLVVICCASLQLQGSSGVATGNTHWHCASSSSTQVWCCSKGMSSLQCL